MDFAKEIVIYRAKHGLTQTDLAKKIGVTMITIHRAEQGSCGKVTRAKLEELFKEDK